MTTRIYKMKQILFSTEMVKAILQWRKRQTRRPVNGKALEWLNDFTPEVIPDWLINLAKYSVGDILYVREKWQLVQPYGPEDYYFGYYDGSYSENEASEKYDYSTPYVWKPSIHMPKEAARIFLKVTNVRIERLHDITDSDSIAEGIDVLFIKELPEHVIPYKDYQNKDNYFQRPDYSFRSLWESIYGKNSWDQNPWVWVYEFEKIAKP